MSFVFNNQIEGGNVQINQGQTVNATQINQGDGLTVEKVIEAVDESIPPEELPEPERVEIKAELQALAAMPIVQQNEPTNLERIAAICDKLSPWGPKIRKGLLAFGEASLKALASTNPVVSGLVAMCQAVKE